MPSNEEGLPNEFVVLFKMAKSIDDADRKNEPVDLWYPTAWRAVANPGTILRLEAELAAEKARAASSEGLLAEVVRQVDGADRAVDVNTGEDRTLEHIQQMVRYVALSGKYPIPDTTDLCKRIDDATKRAEAAEARAEHLERSVLDLLNVRRERDAHIATLQVEKRDLEVEVIQQRNRADGLAEQLKTEREKVLREAAAVVTHEGMFCAAVNEHCRCADMERAILALASPTPVQAEEQSK